MTNYEKKEEQALTSIAKAVEKLDEELTNYSALDTDTEKKHELKKWYIEKKAIHEIKKILHEVGKYSKYDEKEMEKIEKYFENFEF